MTDFASRAFWDDQAASFDVPADHGLSDDGTRQAWWNLLKQFLPTAPARVADLGCGTGSISVLLSEHSYDVVGIDFSSSMVQCAKEKANKAGLNVEFLEGDVARPDLPDASFDVVLARHVLWALPQPSSALRSWRQLLRPGGQFVLVEGRWSTGSGLRASDVQDMLTSVAEVSHVQPLTDPTLWGGQISDERYAMIAHVSLALDS